MFNIIPIIVIALLAYASAGCSTSVLVKDCNQVTNENAWKCKTLKPWE